MCKQIIQNIAEVQSAFQAGAKLAEQENMQAFAIYLKNDSSSFLSAKYEGASYQYALMNIDFLEKKWLCFANDNPQHQTQIYVGLGWALAETNNLNCCFELNFISEIAKQKVADGFGFYEGTFRKRKVISLAQNNTFPKQLIQDYYAGLGRSIWYNSKGNINEVLLFLEKFPEQIKPYLWKGIGTAFCYVGGFSKKELEQIVLEASNYKQQFSDGVEACYISRKKSMLVTNEIRLAVAYFSIKE